MDRDGNVINNVSTLQDDEDHCVVCLDGSTETEPLMVPSSFFVSECRCKYLAHKKCMNEWVTKQIKSNKQMLCPNCNSKASLAVEYELVVHPKDVRIDLTANTNRPRTRTQDICDRICVIG